jgi:hypothetical protein
MHQLVNNAIEKINKFELLSNDDLSSLMNMNPELQRSFEVNQLWRSESEMRYSVLNSVKFPTPAAKYWQAVREESLFYQELIMLVFEYEKALGHLELAKIELDEIDKTTLKGKARAKIKNADIKQKEFGLFNMKIQAKDRIRELKLWEKIKQEQIEKDDFDTEDFSKHHKEMYEKRWTQEMNIAQMTNNPHTFRNSKANLEELKNDSNC